MSPSLKLMTVLVGMLASRLGQAAAEECDFVTQLLPLQSQLDPTCTSIFTMILGGTLPDQDTICGCLLQLTSPPDCTLATLSATVSLSASRAACPEEEEEAPTTCPPASGKPAVLVMGDSMTSFSLQTVGDFCTNEDVYNVAVGGLLAANWFTTQPDTAAWLPACVGPASVESIWLVIGGNDFLYNNCAKSSSFMLAHTTTLEAILGSLQSHFPNAGVVLTGYAIPMMPPLVPGFNLTGCSDASTLDWLNSIHAQVAEANENVTYVNISNAFGGDWDTYSNPDFFADAIHPNALGYCTLASMPVFQEAIGCDGLGRVPCTLPPTVADATLPPSSSPTTTTPTESGETYAPTAGPTTSEPTPKPSGSPTPEWPVNVYGTGDDTGATGEITTIAYTFINIVFATLTDDSQSTLRQAVKEAYLARAPMVPEWGVVGVYLAPVRGRRRTVGSTVAYVVLASATALVPRISIALDGELQVNVPGVLMLDLPDVFPSAAPISSSPVTQPPAIPPTTVAPTRSWGGGASTTKDDDDDVVSSIVSGPLWVPIVVFMGLVLICCCLLYLCTSGASSNKKEKEPHPMEMAIASDPAVRTSPSLASIESNSYFAIGANPVTPVPQSPHSPKPGHYYPGTGTAGHPAAAATDKTPLSPVPEKSASPLNRIWPPTPSGSPTTSDP